MNNKILNFGYFTIKTSEFLEKQKIAGKVLSQAFVEMEKHIQPGISTLTLSKIAEEYILDNNCIPTFKGYKGFPETVCASINKQLVHGIPKNDVFLNDGDVLKLDAGAQLDGVIADMARTYSVGNVSSKYVELICCCKLALLNAIKTIKKGSTLGDVGYAIKKTALTQNVSVITSYGGHSVTYNNPHDFPFINNVGNPGNDLLIRENQTYCIEPMFVYGDSTTTVLDDKWTVVLKDIGVHFEDTIFVKDNFEVDIITK